MNSSSLYQIEMVNSIMESIHKQRDEIMLIGLEKAGYDVSDPIYLTYQAVGMK